MLDLYRKPNGICFTTSVDLTATATGTVTVNIYLQDHQLDTIPQLHSQVTLKLLREQLVQYAAKAFHFSSLALVLYPAVCLLPYIYMYAVCMSTNVCTVSVARYKNGGSTNKALVKTQSTYTGFGSQSCLDSCTSTFTIHGISFTLYIINLQTVTAYTAKVTEGINAFLELSSFKFPGITCLEQSYFINCIRQILNALIKSHFRQWNKKKILYKDIRSSYLLCNYFLNY